MQRVIGEPHLAGPGGRGKRRHHRDGRLHPPRVRVRVLRRPRDQSRPGPSPRRQCVPNRQQRRHERRRRRQAPGHQRRHTEQQLRPGVRDLKHPATASLSHRRHNLSDQRLTRPRTNHLRPVQPPPARLPLLRVQQKRPHTLRHSQLHRTRRRRQVHLRRLVCRVARAIIVRHRPVIDELSIRLRGPHASPPVGHRRLTPHLVLDRTPHSRSLRQRDPRPAVALEQRHRHRRGQRRLLVVQPERRDPVQVHPGRQRPAPVRVHLRRLRRHQWCRGHHLRHRRRAGLQPVPVQHGVRVVVRLPAPQRPARRGVHRRQRRVRVRHTHPARSIRMRVRLERGKNPVQHHPVRIRELPAVIIQRPASTRTEPRKPKPVSQSHNLILPPTHASTAGRSSGPVSNEPAVFTPVPVNTA